MKVLFLALAPVPKKKQVSHKKATPEQIRKFNDLQKKQAK